MARHGCQGNKGRKSSYCFRLQGAVHLCEEEASHTRWILKTWGAPPRVPFLPLSCQAPGSNDKHNESPQSFSLGAPGSVGSYNTHPSPEENSPSSRNLKATDTGKPDSVSQSKSWEENIQKNYTVGSIVVILAIHGQITSKLNVLFT